MQYEKYDRRIEHTSGTTFDGLETREKFITVDNHIDELSKGLVRFARLRIATIQTIRRAEKEVGQ